jgi:hypothetical protein
MPSRFDSSQDSGRPHPDTDIDLSKRYDVYVWEREHRLAVFRNVLFKGLRDVFRKSQYDTFGSFLELEQANGETIFVGRSGVLRFCEHGTKVDVGQIE